ncbi:MAG: cellulase family glycosylhydrolase [Clostridiales bacterium]|nr:cellulase family glycosylhydrolase [Clostridiales bacterium]
MSIKTKACLGLYVEDGMVKLNGTPFYGFGTNYYDIASRPFYDPNCTDFEIGINHLKEFKIPYIRARFSAWGNEGMDLFWNDREQYWLVMDRCVELCEKHHIGIIAVLAWTTHPFMHPFASFDLPMSFSEFIRREDTVGYQKLLEYVEAVVNRYKDSPAIWGWEIGNEYNLACDVNPLYLQAADLAAFFYRVGARIRECDGTNRIIEHGNSQNRPGSYYLMQLQAKADSWPDYSVWSEEKQDHVMEYDTCDQMAGMMELYDNQYFSMCSTHLYNCTQVLGGKTVTLAEYVEFFVDVCKKMGKPLFVGEYCDDEINGVTQWTPEIEAESLAKFQVLHEAMVNNDVQMAMLWMESNDRDIYYRLNSYHTYMLTRVKEANESFIAAGKQKADEYWNNVTPIFYHN